jgi:hypothetical protein
MNYEVYEDVYKSPDFGVFDFISVGKNGTILKRIAFVPTEIPYVYNLAFGNIKNDGRIDYNTVSDNGDRNKLLATIANVVDQYTCKYPERLIYFRGSTDERTRLYRMAVGINLEELSEKFEIYGEVDNEDDFVLFRKNMRISAFLIKRKIV